MSILVFYAFIGALYFFFNIVYRMKSLPNPGEAFGAITCAMIVLALLFWPILASIFLCRLCARLSCACYHLGARGLCATLYRGMGQFFRNIVAFIPEAYAFLSGRRGGDDK